MSGTVPSSHTSGQRERHTPSQRSSASSAKVILVTTHSVVAVYITSEAQPTSSSINATRWPSLSPSSRTDRSRRNRSAAATASPEIASTVSPVWPVSSPSRIRWPMYIASMDPR